MIKGRICKLLFLGAATSLISHLAHGDDYHYRNLMIGERATGLGGAYVAISDDPSGIYHNPAGIMFSFENYFSLSANAYNTSSTVYKDVFGDQDYRTSSSGVVPNFFGFIQNYRKMKWGFAIVVPNSDSIDQDDNITNISSAPTGADTFSRKLFQQNTTTLFGPAIAFEAAPNLTVGMTLFVGYHVNKAIDNQKITYNDGRYYILERSFKKTILTAVPKIGIQYMPLPKWSFGLVVSQPFTFSSKLSQRIVEKDSNVAGLPVDEKATSEPDALHNLEVGMGAAYLPSKRFLLSTDFYYYGASEFADGLEAAPTWNVSVGTEYYFTEKFATRVGLFTNNANTPAISKTKTNQLDHVNFYGVSTGFSWLNSGSSFTLGATYSMGTGTAQVVGDVTSTQDVVSNNAMIYLTGSYQL